MKPARAALYYSVMAIFVATAAVTLLGVTGALTISEGYLDVLFTALVIELVAAVIGLFQATDWFGGGPVPPGIEAVQGDWWQLVRSEYENAVSFVQIGYSTPEYQLDLEGESFAADGTPYAHFYSVSGSVNAATLDLYYFWKGDHARSDDDFSGVGFVHFSSSMKEGRVDRGTGWFTSGNIDRVDVTARRKVEMRRASAEETEAMTSPTSTLAKRRQTVTSVCAARKTVA